MNTTQKRIFLIIAVINVVVQMMDDDLRLSNWVSAICFSLAALYFWFQKPYDSGK